ncbi:NlpC/P60 family protein [Ruminococcus sp. OA3]|uniref:C40 family peptidase n=1 Tax=Ruminococcus sp. OA3 TaxID=2914164 RepID=UPI001F058DDE|nr:C40 family peptidase [Ruminococcus sp. OA3]MCH1984315.1 NlpC/P60 family protein [Ruminococcus sp. OA3]
MKKKFLCLFLAIVISSMQVVPALADRESDLRNEKAATSSQLEATNSQIYNLEVQKEALQAEIDQMDAQLVDIMVAIDVLTEEISQKQAEIEETKAKLQEAEATRDKQYEDMKTRMDYIYRNGGSSGWAQMVLSEENVSAMLNKAEYTQQLYDYDRDKLEEYKETVQQVTDLGNQLATEKADLEVMQNDYKEQETALESALEEKKATSSDYANQIAVAEQQAAQYKALIEQQTAELAQIEEAKRKAAEEAARKAAAEAARKEAAAEAARQAEAESNDEEDSSDESSNHDSSYDDNDSSEDSDNASSDNSSHDDESDDNSSYDNDDSDDNGSEDSSDDSSYEENDDSSYDDDSDSSGDVSYSGTGQSVVNYATQFVGNPYVWGGESLTNGADCSGFIMKVYEKFGVSLPHSSSAMRSCGTGVSYSQAMPGDIICYSGHVAIYMGGGSIVHASNERDGIKISGNAAYRTILAVRRVI